MENTIKNLATQIARSTNEEQAEAAKEVLNATNETAVREAAQRVYAAALKIENNEYDEQVAAAIK